MRHRGVHADNQIEAVYDRSGIEERVGAGIELFPQLLDGRGEGDRGDL